MNVKVVVVSIWAEDVSAAVRFYQDVIGLQPIMHHGGRPYFDLDGTYLTILKGCPRPALDSVPSRFPVVAFSVPNLDTMVERLCACQIELPWGIEEGETGRWVVFHDSAGNLIELAEHKHAAR